MNINESYHQHLAALMGSEKLAAPRGLPTREQLGRTFTWNMAQPLITDRVRNLNYRFAFGEPAWILSGENGLPGIRRYMKNYSQFSDDGITLSGAYGPPFRDQLPYIIKTLRGDLFSRQAVMTLWRPKPGPSKDIPCTVSVQFILRDGLIHTLVHMRSSDAWLGLPYDVVAFTMMSYAVASLYSETFDMAPGLGTGTIFIGSAHVYENHWDIAQDMLAQAELPVPACTLNPRAFCLRIPYENRLEQLIYELRELAENAREMPDIDRLQGWVTRRLG